MKICKTEGCEKKHAAKGYCCSCYHAWRRETDPKAHAAAVAYSKRSYEKHAEKRIAAQKVYASTRKEHIKNYRDTRYRENRAELQQVARDYYQTVKDSPEFKAKRRAYAEANKERLAAYMLQYRAENRELVLRLNREWREANPDAVRAGRAKAKAERRRAEGLFTARDWRNLLVEFNYTCPACGKTGAQLTVDHVIPIAKGGTNWPDNIQPLCSFCNTSKGARHSTRYVPWPCDISRTKPDDGCTLSFVGKLPTLESDK